VTIGAGDFLLVRTRQMERCLAEGWGTFAGGDAPGMKFETADLCRTRDIAAVATDTCGLEVRPNEVEGIFQPWHWVVIRSSGLDWARCFISGNLPRTVYEFMFIGAALPFIGTVGCPLNPMAV